MLMQLEEASEEASRLRAVVAASQRELDDALAERDMRAREGASLSEQISDLISSFEREKRQAARELDRMHQRHDQLQSRLEEMSVNGEDIVAERDAAQQRAADAFRQLGEAAVMITGLEVHISKLISSIEFTNREKLSVGDRLERVSIAVQIIQTDLDESRSQAASQQAHIEMMTASAAAEAERLRETEAEVQRLKDLLTGRAADARDAQREAAEQLRTLGERMTELSSASKTERSALVHASLSSLAQLKEHLTLQLTGLKVGFSVREGADIPTDKYLADRTARKYRWGAVAPPSEHQLITHTVRVFLEAVPLAARGKSYTMQSHFSRWHAADSLLFPVATRAGPN